jgi:putative holliday junction resolvase
MEPKITGVILAIDYGLKRLGLALSDERRVTSRPFATWRRVNRRRDLARLRELVREHAVRRIVVGLPLHMDGRPSEMSETARAFAARVERVLGIPVEMIDERLSSWEAGRSLAATRSTGPGRQARAGHSRSMTKAPIDDVAAAVILRDYLDRAHSKVGAQD